MKKFVLIFSTVLFLSFNMFIIPSVAEPNSYGEGYYTIKDLNLSPNTIHTIQNNSPTEYAFVAIFDSTGVTRQFIRLSPKSEKYTLASVDQGYEIIIIGNGEVLIS